MSDNKNMRIWDDLGVTDPENTKGFKRAGGFSGTAIKPMWIFKRLTQRFGPAGTGWGTIVPHYQVVSAENEILVYCTAGIWYKENDIQSEIVYGVGGDKVLTQIQSKDSNGKKILSEDGKFKTYGQTNDEAFKAAYTDALTNAAKLIGVAADVHMGLFDDNKYLKEAADSFDDEGNRISPEVKSSKPKLISKTDRDLFISTVKAAGATGVVKEKLAEFGFASSGEITQDKFPSLTEWIKNYKGETA